MAADNTIMAADIMQKAQEYKSEAHKLNRILNALGLTAGDTSQQTAINIRNLVSIAMSLKLRDCSETSLLLAITSLKQRQLTIASAYVNEQYLTSQFEQKTADTIEKTLKMRRALEAAEVDIQDGDAESKKRQKQCDFLSSKSSQYHKQILMYQDQLDSSNVDVSLYHDNLLAKSEVLTQLQDQIKPLRAELRSFEDLPPNVHLSRVKIEESRRELARLEAELGESLDLMRI